MKHGVAFRKFSRTSSHRMLMLRNLVTSLIQHEQVKTTLPKARDTARLAEKVVSFPPSYHHTREKGHAPSLEKAAGFLLEPSLTPKLFDTLAARYAQRPGGYTRIHKFGHRPGDNAPHAVLELVDGPRDLRFEMAARAAGWDVLCARLKTDVERERRRALGEVGGEGGGVSASELRERTRWNVRKALRYRSREDIKRFGEKVQGHMVGPAGFTPTPH
ncbi:ribosomal protein L17 [Russula vinacea]|nr:ribosomal protein L17 [Russula vinacea]